MYCSNCGNQISEGSSFCSKCGRSVSNISTTASFQPKMRNAVNSLHKMHLCKLVFLSAITLGIYYTYWFLRQKDALNSLDSTEKISAGTIITCLVLSILSLSLGLFSAFMEGFAGASTGEPNVIRIIGDVIGLTYTIILIVQCFKIRRIFIDHFQEKFSGLATLFFGALYLQYKINRF